jgi:hypothetical protein
MLKMKRLVLLSLLLFPIFLFAQYPTFSNKQKLGVQTTGDGLIFRGTTVNNIPTYTPSNINNAYFHLDTTNNKLYLYNTNYWHQVYPAPQFDTTTLNVYLKISDTTAMLLPYFRDSDTTQLNLINRFALKLNISDTSVMLLPYLRKADTISLSNRINNKLNATDTVSLSNRINLKLNKTDTINLSNRIDLKLNPTDTISLSNRINTKLNPSDTVSLSNRINKKLDTLYVNYQTSVDLLTNKDTINITTLEAGAGINIVNNVISLDTVLLDSVVRVQNVYVKNGTGTVLNKGEAVYVTGAAGTNILVGRASNVTESSSSKTLGLTMTSIGVNGFGYVIKEGLLKGLNTNSATAGDPIWLGVNGALIFGLANKPFAPKHLVYLGVVTDKNPSVGEVYVTVQNGFEIKELHDVQIIDPVNKASLYYNSSESLWRDTTATLLVSDTTSMLSKYVNTYSNQTNINGNKTFNNVITIDSATVTGKLLVNTNISDAVKITSNTNSTNLELANSSGSSVYIKSSNKNMILQTDTTALVYLNGDNKKVGILTMTPQQELEVNGNARITGLNNNLVPTNLVGSSNNNDLTNVHLGEGLSFTNDTLKVDLTIIDTAIAGSSITLTGHVTGTGSTNSTVPTIIGNGIVTNDMLAGSISDSKLNTITTVGKISNSATTATSSNTNSAIVSRNSSGDFSAGIITASLNGNASTATNVAYSGLTGAVPIWNQNTTGNAATVTSVTPSNFASQTANTVLAAPNGSSGTPTFRSLASADIPNLNYLPLTGGTTSGLITSSFSNTNNYSTSAEDNNSFTIYNNTTSTNNIYGGLKFLIGENSGAIPGGPGLAQIYGIRAGGASNPSTDLTFSTKSNVSGLLEKMRIKFDGKVGIGTSTPSYLLDVNGQIGSTGFFKSGGLSTQFLKADGSVDANTYLTTGTAASTYLPLAGGTLTGALNGTTGNFKEFTISNTTGGNGLLTIKSENFNFANRIEMGDGSVIRTKIGTDNSSSSFIFELVPFSGSSRGYKFYSHEQTTANLGLTQDRRGNVGIKRDFTFDHNYTLDVNGTLGVTGATTFKDFGSHTFVNYIQNGDFDLTSTIDASAFVYGYPHYIPLHWKSAATSRYVSTWSSTGGYSSPQHFKQYDGDASTGGALYQDVTNWQDLKGKTVTACGWFTKGTLTNSGNHAEIQINDGLTTTTTSIGTTTSWQRACVTKTISASATRVRVIVGCNLAVSGEGGAVSDMDAISLVIGEGKHEFSHKPLFDRDTQRLSGTLLIGYDSENNLAYNPSATSNLKVAGSTSLNGTLGVSGVTTLSNLSGGSTRMVTASTTGVLSTQAIPTGTLGGSGTINYIPKFTAASTIGNSSIFNNAIGDVGINDDTPSYKLDVNGTFRVVNGSLFNGIMYVEDNAIFYKDVTVNRDLFMNTSQSFSGNGILTDYLKNTGIKFYDSALGNITIFNKTASSSFGSIIFSTGNSTGNANGLPTERMRISYEGNVSINNNLSVTGQTTLTNLGGNGNRMVVTNNSGLLSTQAIPSGGSGTVTNVTAGSPANGLSVATGTTTPVISMALAGSGTIGVVSASTQVFSGAKTFNDNVIISGTSTLNVGSNGTFGGRVNTPWLERTYINSTATTMTVNPNITWLNIHQDATVTLTLPNAATYPGKELIIKQTGAGVVLSSGSPNIIGFTTAYNTDSPQTVIINPTTWRYVTLVSDGTYWIIMQRNN